MVHLGKYHKQIEYNKLVLFFLEYYYYKGLNKG